MQNKKTAIITGGAKGIGFACARRFLADGYNIVIADIDKQAGQAAIEKLVGEETRGDSKSDGRNSAVFICTDIADKLSIHNLLPQTLNAFGRIDVLINNAGIIKKGGILGLSVEEFDQVLGINLRGAFLISQLVAKHMVKAVSSDTETSKNNGLSIINISSINAKLAIADILAYEVSKGGMNQLTKAMALELAPFGIRVNAIGPGSIKTDMLKDVAKNEQALDMIYSRTPLGRLGKPEEIAGVAAFLASEDASYITGECIYVDGGRLALNYIMNKKANRML